MILGSKEKKYKLGLEETDGSAILKISLVKEKQECVSPNPLRVREQETVIL